MRLVIDTDTASDDAVALMLALARPDVTVDAITSVAGNVDLDQATANAFTTLDLMSADVPVYRGRHAPLTRELSTATHVHGADGFSGASAPSNRTAQPESADDALIRLASQHPGELTLVTLGPLSNVALAVLRDPELLDKFAAVYCMGGSPDGRGNVTASAEYNLWADPESAQIVLNAARPDKVTVIGWNISRQYAVLTAEDQSRLAGLDSARGDFLLRVNAAVADWCRDVTGLDGFDLPDPIAMALAMEPKAITASEAVRMDVATDPRLRGSCVLDRRVSAAPANVTVAWETDGGWFKDQLFALCAEGTRV